MQNGMDLLISIMPSLAAIACHTPALGRKFEFHLFVTFATPLDSQSRM